MRRPLAAAAAAFAVACGGGGDRTAQRDTSATVALPPPGAPIPPAPESSFAWFAGLALTELRDSVNLAQWLAAHQNDTLPREDGAWCAQAVATEDIEEDRIAVRRAYFYQPVPPADSKRMPRDHPDLSHECVLGAIVVRMEAAARSDDSLLDGVRLEQRRLFQAPLRSANYHFGAARDTVIGDDGKPHRGDTLQAWGRLPLSDSTEAMPTLQDVPPAAPADSEVVHQLREYRADCDLDLDSLATLGEGLLIGARDPSTSLVVHYLVADARAEQVYREPTARALRASAISHYRAALALEPATPSTYSRRARWILWRLLAGLGPGIHIAGLQCDE